MAKGYISDGIMVIQLHSGGISQREKKKCSDYCKMMRDSQESCKEW